jgi:hypothetical protein
MTAAALQNFPETGKVQKFLKILKFSKPFQNIFFLNAVKKCNLVPKQLGGPYIQT